MSFFEENFTIKINLEKLINKSDFLKNKNFQIEGNDQINSQIISNTLLKIYKYCTDFSNKNFEACRYYRLSDLEIRDNIITLNREPNFPQSKDIMSGFIDISCILFDNELLEKTFNRNTEIQDKESIAKLLNKISPNNYNKIYDLVDKSLFRNDKTTNSSEVYKKIFDSIDSRVSAKRFNFRLNNSMVSEVLENIESEVESSYKGSKTYQKRSNFKIAQNSKKITDFENGSLLDYEKVNFGESEFISFNTCFEIGNDNNIIIKRKNRSNPSFLMINKNFMFKEILNNEKDVNIDISYHVNFVFKGKGNKTYIQQELKNPFILKNLPFKTNKENFEALLKRDTYFNISEEFYNMVRKGLNIDDVEDIVLKKIIQIILLKN